MRDLPPEAFAPPNQYTPQDKALVSSLKGMYRILSFSTPADPASTFTSRADHADFIVFIFVDFTVVAVRTPVFSPFRQFQPCPLLPQCPKHIAAVRDHLLWFTVYLVPAPDNSQSQRIVGTVEVAEVGNVELEGIAVVGR